MNLSDTIAAISTPHGKGGIAVIRISGADALSVADRVFRPASGISLCNAVASRAYYGGTFSEGVQIDDGIAVCFLSPHSFTGEDTVEISCHGGVLITRRVLEAVFCAGARPAEAGEFTRRAFVNGKMKLTGAEALGDLLSAQTNEQIQLARSVMHGSLSQKTDTIYNSLCRILASVYACIDYPDEDLAEMSREQMLAAVDECISSLEGLKATYRTGHAVAEGINTVIVGRTNAGKSSLYNAILGRDAAIVTDVEGTTRDILTETATLGRVVLRLSDTAGLRETDDRVERIGVERARQALESSELVLAVMDGSVPPTREDTELLHRLKADGRAVIAVLSKSDLGICDEAREAARSVGHFVCLSTTDGSGLSELEKVTEQIYIDKELDTGRDAVISNARQYSAVSRGLSMLEGARDYICGGHALEVCCSELEGAMEAIGELDGRTVSEDIVSRIFAEFCVGK